ncbi:MAG TPA: hypothetical protein VFC75_04550, partial [Erysipelothrix sp.]|nr:hypothetical protein [Erysipelothrix sp.]
MVGIKKYKLTQFLSLSAMLIFFYLPIVIMIIFSFNSTKSLTNFSSFSLRWYEDLLYNSELMDALKVSVILAILSTFIATIVGTLTSIGLIHSK